MGAIWNRPPHSQPLSSSCVSQCVDSEHKMEVDLLSPVAQSPFSLTPTKGSPEEDDGFVELLENDLKVSSLAPLVPAWDQPKEKNLQLLHPDYGFTPWSE